MALWRTPVTQVGKPNIGLAAQGDFVRVRLQLEVIDGDRHATGSTRRESNSELYITRRKPRDNRGCTRGVGGGIAVASVELYGLSLIAFVR